MNCILKTRLFSQVPVIAVFTKYDQFVRNVKIHLEDYGDSDDNESEVAEEKVYEVTEEKVYEVAEKQFQEHYIEPLGYNNDGYVRLESGLGSRILSCTNVSFAEMHRRTSSCEDLIEKTAIALNEDIVALMLLAVRRGNLALSVRLALNR